LESASETSHDSIERARATAHRIFTRSLDELRKIQTERQLRPHLHTPAHGLANAKAIAQAAHNAVKTAGEAAEAALFERVAAMRRKSMEIDARIQQQHAAANFAKQSQSAPPEALPTPRGAPCSCGSGIKFKRCCGKDAPPVLGRAA
ncbi:MAG: SEC-C metal-binding domain-containing protein, partial [Acidobacteriota bacterium]|nr:SEC-C metal-binding domain-containing protein [Acidobacteriota bacterium]